jgi:transcriptional regulator with XRE-family HTH domain
MSEKVPVLEFVDALAAEVRATLAGHTPRRTAKELADHLGLSQQSVSNKLNGKSAFTLTEFHYACEWLGVSATDLMRRAREATQ